MIIIAGTIDFNSVEDRDKAVDVSKPLQQATRSEEAGCEAYCLAPDPCVDTKIQVYELWDDEASLAAHFQHENYFKMREALGQCNVADAATKKFRCDLAEPVYDDDDNPRPDFFTAGGD